MLITIGKKIKNCAELKSIYRSSLTLPVPLPQFSFSSTISNNTELSVQVSGYAQEMVLNTGYTCTASVTYTIRTPHQNSSIVIIGTNALPHPRIIPATQ